MEVDYTSSDISLRILQLIRYKGFDSNAAFAEFMGWSRQYLNNLLAGKTIGLSVVTSLCIKFPEISARWILLGEGIMLDLTNHMTSLRSWVTLSDFIHVMTPEDRAKIDAGKSWTLEDLKRWECALLDYQASVRNRMSKLEKIEQNG